MAFRNADLSVLAYANGITTWQYGVSKDTIEQITEDDYFGECFTLMNQGDFVLISASDGATVRYVSSVGKNSVILSKLS